MRHESYINEIEEPCYNVESINGLPSRQQKSMAQYQYRQNINYNLLIK